MAPNEHRRRHPVAMFLGEDLLAWLTLAFGAALFVGNFLAIVKPPARQLDDTNLERAPVLRSAVLAVLRDNVTPEEAAKQAMESLK